ncbi:MAG: type I glutamate--ammonia ligase [Lachnospira sp.]|nr:type I glutamate--ammonia ligase [Lachnospira sp.]
MYSEEDILRMIEEEDVEFIRLQFTDMFGVLKNVAVTASQMAHVLKHGCMFDGSSIDGYAREEESDMYLRPDLDTFVIFPWRPQAGKVARLICSVYKPDGTLFAGDPRQILRVQVQRAQALGYTFDVGPECEFFLFHTDENGQPTTEPGDDGGYFDLGPTDLGENVRRDIVMNLENMGYQVEGSHHETAPGQHEVDFRYGEALSMADKIMTFKLAVKTLARRHGLWATFMPKPRNDCAGSGMHINMSLMKGDQNIFGDAADPDGLSETAKHFMAGIMAHARGMAAITNPLVNSYKRFQPGFEAPIYIAWARQNRSPLVRIPAASVSNTRVELRSADSAANPYLALAVCLAAGLDGIEKKMTPPAPITGNPNNMTDEQRAAAGIRPLPLSLDEALEEMDKDRVVKDALGEYIAGRYIRAKRREWKEYAQCVSDWEINRYLGKY